MSTRNIIKALSLALLLCPGTNLYAQASLNGPQTIWKNKVSRVVDLVEKADNKTHHLRDAKPDGSLLEMMLNDIRAGKLVAYRNFDAEFTTVLTKEALNDIISGRTDTINLTDPVTKAEITKIVRRDFDYDAVHKYRILENWAFNTTTGKTEIQIIGIAPLKEIYGDAGDFRGVQAMFWVKYSDAANLLMRHAQSHPLNNINTLIWADYFTSDVQPKVQK